MQLSKRMDRLASMVTEGSSLADVGTDHGYIPIALVQTGKVSRAIAMDINKGPLERAALHIREQHLEDRITTRLSDGMTALKEGAYPGRRRSLPYIGKRADSSAPVRDLAGEGMAL